MRNSFAVAKKIPFTGSLQLAFTLSRLFHYQSIDGLLVTMESLRRRGNRQTDPQSKLRNVVQH